MCQENRSRRYNKDMPHAATTTLCGGFHFHPARCDEYAAGHFMLAIVFRGKQRIVVVGLDVLIYVGVSTLQFPYSPVIPVRSMLCTKNFCRNRYISRSGAMVSSVPDRRMDSFSAPPALVSLEG